MSISSLFFSVLKLFCFMLPGFVLRKLNLVNANFAKALSVLTVYVTQGAMFLHSYIVEYNPEIFKGILLTFVISLCVHLLFYVMAKQTFKKAPEEVRKVLHFGLMFSNAGYMGIPVVESVFGPEYTVYVTIYVIWFNVFTFSLGRLIYTGDKKYMSIKEAIVNPAVIPILAGIVLYFTGVGGWVQNMLSQPTLAGETVSAFYSVLTALKGLVAPMTMMIVGVRLAELDFGGIFKDKKVYIFTALRMLVFPTVVWLLLKPLNMFGVVDMTVMSIVIVLASTPSAAATSMFAELYGGDKVYAGKVVAITTLMAIITMPIVALLLNI